MDVLPNFVDMAITPKEREEEYGQGPMSSGGPQPMYPYGLCLSFCQDELEKLDLDDDCEPGDTVHLFCLAKVTSVSKSDTTEGTKTRIEMQITHIAAESEDDENEEADARMPRRMDYNKLYK